MWEQERRVSLHRNLCERTSKILPFNSSKVMKPPKSLQNKSNIIRIWPWTTPFLQCGSAQRNGSILKDRTLEYTKEFENKRSNKYLGFYSWDANGGRLWVRFRGLNSSSRRYPHCLHYTATLPLLRSAIDCPWNIRILSHLSRVGLLYNSLKGARHATTLDTIIDNTPNYSNFLICG